MGQRYLSQSENLNDAVIIFGHFLLLMGGIHLSRGLVSTLFVGAPGSDCNIWSYVVQCGEQTRNYGSRFDHCSLLVNNYCLILCTGCAQAVS